MAEFVSTEQAAAVMAAALLIEGKKNGLFGPGAESESVRAEVNRLLEDGEQLQVTDTFASAMYFAVLMAWRYKNKPFDPTAIYNKGGVK